MAEHLGYASPGKMLREMSGKELQQWKVYFTLKQERERDQELDRKGKQKLAALMRGRRR